MRVCACACMYKRNPSVEHHPIAKFLEAAKVKSANFSDIIHLYSVCLLIEAAVFPFLPPIIPRQWLTSLAWHLCTEAHSPALDGEKDIFEPIAGQPWCSPLCFYTRCPYGFLTSSAISVLHFSLPALPRQFAWSQPSLPVYTYDTPLGKPLILLLFTAVLFCRIAVAASASPHCRVLACACSHFHCWAARLFVSCTLLALVSFLFYLMGIIFAVFVLLQVVQECRKQATDATELWPRWFRRHCLNAIGLLVVLLIC